MQGVSIALTQEYHTVKNNLTHAINVPAPRSSKRISGDRKTWICGKTCDKKLTFFRTSTSASTNTSTAAVNSRTLNHGKNLRYATCHPGLETSTEKHGATSERMVGRFCYCSRLRHLPPAPSEVPLEVPLLAAQAGGDLPFRFSGLASGRYRRLSCRWRHLSHRSTPALPATSIGETRAPWHQANKNQNNRCCKQ